MQARSHAQTYDQARRTLATDVSHAITLAVENLRDQDLPPYWIIKNCILVSWAQTNWEAAEDYRRKGECHFRKAQALASGNRFALSALEDLRRQLDDIAVEQTERAAAQGDSQTSGENSDPRSDQEAQGVKNNCPKIRVEHVGDQSNESISKTAGKPQDISGSPDPITPGEMDCDGQTNTTPRGTAPDEMELDPRPADGIDEIIDEEQWQFTVKDKGDKEDLQDADYVDDGVSEDDEDSDEFELQDSDDDENEPGTRRRKSSLA